METVAADNEQVLWHYWVVHIIYFGFDGALDLSGFILKDLVVNE